MAFRPSTLVAMPPSLICSFSPATRDLEKLVEIAADDTQVFQPLQQRNGRVFSLRQHSAVEFELAEFAVEELLGNELSRQAAAF